MFKTPRELSRWYYIEAIDMKNALTAAPLAALFFSGAFLIGMPPLALPPSGGQEERPRLAGPPAATRVELLKKRVDEMLPGAMRQTGVDCWIVLTRENSRDPIAQDLGGGTVVGRSAFIFTLGKSSELKATAIVASFDAEALAGSGIYERLISYNTEGLAPHLRKIVHDAKPKRIALNYSRDHPLADGLTVGMRAYLIDALGEDYAKRFVSSEDLLVSFRSRLLPEEVEIYRRAVELTQQILLSALSSRAVTPEKTTDQDIEDFLKERTHAASGEVAFISVAFDPSSADSSAAGRLVHRGDLIRVDFGIRWHGYRTDIQRTAYVLREDESGPPASIKKMWDTAVKANRAAVMAMKPGVTGEAVDAVARKVITGAGYIDYPHLTGHPVSVEVHDAGTVLGPDWKERYGSRVFRKLEADQILAVEPEVSKYDSKTKSEVSIGLEEEVIVESGGAKYLGQPQVELIIVR
jgi:Xaa-Pro dipeptidase